MKEVEHYSNSLSKKAIKTFYERVDIEKLDLLLACTNDKIDIQLKKRLKKYKEMIQDEVVEVKYYHSEFLQNKGRLYAGNSLSLQNFKRCVRHFLAKENYIDIDIDNAHPSFISQYCKKEKIECPNLDDYVLNREKWLKNICRHHNISREEAKKLVLRLFYLGRYMIDDVKIEKPLKKLEKLRNELKNIANEISEKEEDLYKKISLDKTKQNKKSVVLAIVSQIIENDCLIAMIKFFEKEKIEVGVLCFDGLMIKIDENRGIGEHEILDFDGIKVEKNKEIIDILDKCCKYVKSITRYNIKLSIKKMNEPLKFDLPKFSNFVEDETECQEKLFKLEGKDKFKVCNGLQLTYNEKSMIYDDQEDTVKYYLSKHQNRLQIKVGKKVLSYGRKDRLMKEVLPIIRLHARDDDWFEKVQTSSLGYLLFKDGIYNMKTGEFSKEFNKKIVFFARIPHKFPKKDEKKIEYAKKLSFDSLFEDPWPMIAALSCSLAGDIYKKKMYILPGRSNAGKSILSDMLHLSFGEYVKTFNAECFAFGDKSVGDEAKNNRWSLLIRYARILISSEIKMECSLNGNSIKKHSSGGDRIVARTHGKEELSFTPHYTCFLMLNDIPKIEPHDDAIQNRLEYLEFPYVFVDKNQMESKDKKDYFKEKKDNITEIIRTKDFIEGFIHILLDGYLKVQKDGFPEFDKKVKDDWTIDTRQGNNLIDIIKDNFEITGNETDKVSVAAMRQFKLEHKDEFKNMSIAKFNKILQEEFSVEEKRTSTSRFFCGIRLKSQFKG